MDFHTAGVLIIFAQLRAEKQSYKHTFDISSHLQQWLLPNQRKINRTKKNKTMHFKYAIKLLREEK